MQRNKYFDVIKALGIISIVAGHSMWNKISMYFYTYHLAIFFLVAGLLYSSPTDKQKAIGKKAISLWKPYVKYSCLFMVCNNFLVLIGLQDGNQYTIPMFLQKSINILLFSSTEFLSGALWFIPFFMITYFIFIFLESNLTKYKYKNGLLCVTCLLFGLWGLGLVESNYRAPYKAQLSFLILPVFYLGYIIKTKKINFRKYLIFPGFIISVLLIFIILDKTQSCIELSANQIISPFLFYPVTFLGMYSCCYIGKIVSQIPKISEAFSEIGKYTFDIMALHFFFLKLVDLAYTVLITKQYDILSKFPHSYGYRMLPFYLLFGVLGPIVVRKACSCLWSKIQPRLISEHSRFSHDLTDSKIA